MKKINNYLIYITIIILSLFPVLELDYLLEWSLPRLSTIIKFIVLPILGLAIFFSAEKKKKKLLFITLYLLLLGTYFIFHHLEAQKIYASLFLTENFHYQLTQELIYIVTLVLPVFYILFFKELKLQEKQLKVVVFAQSIFTAIPIFLGNLFTFGKSTYVGYTKANIFFWFTNQFNERSRHPRFYASKFFFKEGNTIGILMTMVLCLLYYFLYQAKTKKEKIFIALLIAIHTIAMIMLSTRIASYGALLVTVVVLAMYLVLALLKKEQFKLSYVLSLIGFIVLTGMILPVSPAVQNQKIDASDYGIMKKTLKYRDSIHDGLKEGEKLIPGSPEYLAFYTFYFEDNMFLINITPPVYYTKYYHYEHDPKFWVDFIFNYDLKERVSGRQLEKIFMDYKWNPTTSTTKLLGMGYSTFMNGSILLEKDFAQQKYTLGYLGAIITMSTWLIVFVLLSIKTLFSVKHWNLKHATILFACAICFASGYVSGHTFDQFNTSLFLALLLGYLYDKYQ